MQRVVRGTADGITEGVRFVAFQQDRRRPPTLSASSSAQHPPGVCGVDTFHFSIVSACCCISRYVVHNIRQACCSTQYYCILLHDILVCGCFLQTAERPPTEQQRPLPASLPPRTSLS